MADPRFFQKTKGFSLSEIAEISGCDVSTSSDLNFVLDDVAPLYNAGKNDLSFLDNVKYKEDFLNTKAGACFISSEMEEYAPKGMICLVTPTPYKAYALAAQAFYPDALFVESSIAQSASIDETADIGENVSIAPNVVIGANVTIGNNTCIGANTVVQNNVKVGSHCDIGCNVTISHALIGDYVRLYPGVRVGQDGFGFAISSAGHVKVPQLGRVIIEDHVEIGANTTIDRGSGPDTVIGQGTWIDNLVQIAHNVIIGRGCIIVSQVGISGSAKIEDYVAIGGQVGIAGHITIGVGARIGAQAGVISDVPGGQEYLGSPAFPKSQFFRQVAALNRLIKKKKHD
ncbi:MAG: UDP-3-O-(3-hydroxymyristoyl)glucosamine N-acyltransferase [Zetaproteobacteria bacterium]|nr:MAG: UDP-3-O-(3-hydroxymyristoyl)glucosamine N-acyltransferase [Zetaproteobacteria bacterium]